jgi:hypothetical protein
MKQIILKIFSLIFLSNCINFTTIAQTDIESALFASNDSVIELQLSEVQKADFKDKALRKTKDLSNYISIIADKSKDEIQRNKAINLATKLFVSENNVVEVSSLKSGTRQFKIRAYLNKLKLLPYVTTRISWYDIFFASDFTKRPDGKYEAVATIYQRFEGITKEGGKYLDITKKNIQIIIAQIENKTGDIVETSWEIFLGDIKVEETKAG